MKPNDWTPQEVLDAARLWVEKKKSGGQIARILRTRTRHAVINKLKSLGITRETLAVPADLNSKGFIDQRELRSYHCRFPLWGDHEPPNGKFCGRPRVAGSAYCACHHELTHRMVKEKYVQRADFLDKRAVQK